MFSEPYDAVDLDAVIELERSRGYSMVAKRVNEELLRKLAVLERGGDPERVRGEIQALRMVLTIPEILRHEIKDSLR